MTPGERLREWGDLIKHQWGHVPGACGLCDGWLALAQAEARVAVLERQRADWKALYEAETRKGRPT